MIALLILSAVFFAAYNVGILFWRKMPPCSISETWYLLPPKWDWLFPASLLLGSVPAGYFWYSSAPSHLLWIPITVVIAINMIGVSCCYKSGPKTPTVPIKSLVGHTGKTSVWGRIWEKIKEMLVQFKPSEFFKYGPQKLIHYVNSLVAIGLVTFYICYVYGAPAVMLTCLLDGLAILFGVNIQGDYNADYSRDADTSSWIFWWEIAKFVEFYTCLLMTPII